MKELYITRLFLIPDQQKLLLDKLPFFKTQALFGIAKVVVEPEMTYRKLMICKNN